MPGSSILTRLLRIRAENAAGRMVAGLGARNVPWVRARKGVALAADLGVYAGDVTAEEQVAAARRLLGVLKTEVAEVERDVTRLRSEARVIDRTVARERGRSLLDKMGIKRKRGGAGIELGPIEIGRAGVQLNAGFMRGAFGKAFSVAIATNAAAGLATSIADGIDKAKAAKAMGSSAVKEIGLSVGRGVAETTTQMFGVSAAAQAASRLFGDVSAEEAQAGWEKIIDDIFTSREEKARRKAAVAAKLEEASEEINRAISQQWTKIEHATPQTFKVRNKAGLRAYRREAQSVNRQLFRVYEIGLKEAAADALKKSRHAGGL